ncbi:cell division protein FtsZ [Candidatus Saccharibacteria bacterium]|nr:cell division protein FtsZ [Candidatus Saccharibacteria bacterium]
MAKQVDSQIETFARIKVVGVGGAGGSAVNRMIESGMTDVEFVVINTDAQALHHSKASKKVHIGPQTTRGLGAGGDPKIGQDAAEESIEDIKAAIADADILFITFGAGGGTGSGASHVIAKTAREMGILTVAFVTKPFGFEAERRARNAEYALSNLEKYIDTLVLIPNDNLLNIIDTETPVQEAFRIADDVLRQSVQGIADLITVHGLINLDFADVKSVMQNAGQALMGIGRASGENRAEVAAQQAINSPLLDVSIDGAKGVLFNVIGGSDMGMHEIEVAAKTIIDAADQDVNVFFGAAINPDLEGELIVTVVATGFNYDYVTAGIRDFGSLETADKEAEEKKAAKQLPKAKISSLEDLPSLPTKAEKEKAEDQDEEDQPDEAEDGVKADEDIQIEEIVKDIDTTIDQDDEGEAGEDKAASIMDDDEDGSSIWDDIEVDDKSVDLNKPTFLRKLAGRRRDRKERKEQAKDSAEADADEDENGEGY